MKQILVTGSVGQIGSELTAALRKRYGENMVVATDIRGCREEVADGENGFLVPPRDHYALGEAALKILSDDDLSARMGVTGRKRVDDLFDERAVTSLQVERLDALTGRNRLNPRASRDT